jgi:CRP-like cAMP-binding protein
MPGVIDQIPDGVYDWAGYLGVAVFLTAYTALQTGLIRGNGYLYASLNMVAAACVLVSLIRDFNLAAALGQVSWIVISAVGMLRVLLLTRAIRFNAEERELLARKFSRLPKIAARRFFNAGLWVDAPAGTCLMREGEAHGVLIYLAAGRAEVYAQGALVGRALPGSFLGEMTVLEGMPATATVTLAEPARIFRVDAEKLHRLGQRDPEFRLQLENALSSDIRMKLVAANERLQDRTDPDATPPGADA